MTGIDRKSPSIPQGLATLAVVFLVVAGPACYTPIQECGGLQCREGQQCAFRQMVCITDDCGNGNLDTGEECDDGNILSGDGCTAKCRREQCPTGFLPPVTIDDFNTAQDWVTASVPNMSVTGAVTSIGANVILGSQRDLLVTKLDDAGSSQASARVAEGKLTLDCQAGVAGKVTIVWDGTANTPTGLGMIDLTSAGSVDAIELAVSAADQPYDLVIDVAQDDTKKSSSHRFERPASGAALLVIPFSQFTSDDVGGSDGVAADFTRAGSITATASGSALHLGLDFLRTTASVRATMVDRVFDRNHDPRPDGKPARPGDRIRYIVTVENPDDAFAFPSDPLVFTFDPSAPPNTGVIELVPGTVMFESPSDGTLVKGHLPGDETVEVKVNAVPDRNTQGACDDNATDPGCVFFQFEVEIPDELPEGTIEIPAQGFFRSDNPTGPNPLAGVPTDDPGTPAELDPSRTDITYCGNGKVDALAGEQCDDGNNDDSDACQNDCKRPAVVSLHGGGCAAAGDLGSAGLALLFLGLLAFMPRGSGSRPGWQRRCAG